MSDFNFQNYLRNDIKQYVKGNNTESIQLLLWTLVNCFDLDESFAETIVCDGENDKGIDAILVDDNEEVILVFQSKFRTINDAQMGDKHLRDFMGVKEWFKDKNAVQNLMSSTINKDLKNLLDEYKICDIVQDYTIQYQYVSNTFRNDDTNEYVRTIEDICIWDIDSLSSSFHMIKDDELVIDELEIKGLSNVIEILIDKEKEIRSLFFILPAIELLNMKGIDDLTLFSKNVRYGLGNSRVNKEIRRTINDTEENDNFLLFHNGISIVCEELDYVESKNTIKMKNYSVVNGAQSILSFYQEMNNLGENIQVMIKLTQVKNNRKLVKLISHYNNNQNAITVQDLRSRDKIQKRIEREFEEIDKIYDTKMIYISRRGTPVPDGYTFIDNGYSAQLISSCYLDRPYNTHLKSSLFDSRYKDVFNRNITASKIIRYYDFHMLLLSEKSNIQNQGIADYSLAQHFLISVISNIYKSSDEINEKLFEDTDYFVNRKKWMNLHYKIYKILISLFNHEIRSEQQNEDFVFKNYFKVESEVTNLSQRIIQGFDTQLSIADTSLIKLYNDCFI